MIYLILAVLSSALISIGMRFGEKYVRNQMGMFMANYAVCLLLAALYLGGNSGFASEGVALSGTFTTSAVVMGAICGVLYLVNFVLLKYNMKKNGVVLSSTFMKLGVLIPTLMAVVVFRETPTGRQIAGIILAVIAIVMIHFEKEAVGEGKQKLGLLVLLILSGTTDSMANIFEQVGAADAQDGYLLITFLTAFLIALVFMLLGKDKVSGKDILFGILIGIPNYYSARFLLLSLSEISAVLVYPVYSVSTIIVITVAGVVFFREKISRKKAAALALILVALGMLNG